MIFINIYVSIREAAKNGIFFIGPATKALPPPLLVAGPLKKRFLAASLRN